MDLLQQAQLRELVVNALTPIGGKRRGESILIYCPFHRETKPSLHVHVGHKIIPGSFRCFGCNAHGNWNELARALHLPYFDFKTASNSQHVYQENEYTEVIKTLLHEIKLQEKDPLKYLSGTEELPDYFMWRGYTGRFYKRFGANYFWDRKQERSYLHFPLYMNKEYVGYTIINVDNRDPERYQIFAEARRAFFMYDYIPNNEPIVLVEGHFDALRLWAEGISALAIFGAKNWSAIKKSYLLSKIPPKVVIAFDGDKAGYDAAISIWKDLRISFYNVDIFYLPFYPEKERKLDPGNMPEFFVNELRKVIYAETETRA